MKTDRRDPDELLKALNRSSQDRRGRLRVFLGMCPGVGKTYSMLKAAHERKARGARVVIGIVETHGRQDTSALIAGLDESPRIQIDYRGSRLEEMDLDAILRARPDIVLVDELAHTNVPGSRHAKRYQDVEEILAAGIDVFTTVNIQHIESRNDLVAQVTGVLVQETVPDSLFDIADEIELIDLSPTELLQRLKEGKVYLGDRAERAADGFFKEERLLALRELALRFVAEKVDLDLHAQMTIKGIRGPWQTNERILVALSWSPYSARLIRVARRMAQNLEAPWVALYVDVGERLKDEDEKTLQKNIALARELGAEVVTIADTDIAHAIQKVSEDRNVTQIVIGRPDRRFFADLFSRGTLLDRLVRETSKVDVHVIRAKRKPRYRGFRLPIPELRTGFFPYYNTAWFMVGISFLCYGLRPVVGYRALGSAFLLSILVVAGFAGAGPILFAALLSAFIWNFFFIPPTFTFAITSFEDVMMVVSFFVAALVAGLLTARIRRHEQMLEVRESRTQLLYGFVKMLSDAKSENEVGDTLASVVQRHFEGESVMLLSTGDAKLREAYPTPHSSDAKVLAVAQWVYENGKAAGWGTDTLNAAPCRCFPLKGNTGVVGVLAYFPVDPKRPLSIDKEIFMETVISQAAIALERMRFAAGAKAAELYAVSERLHQTLLNSISHELRTPITALIGSASALKDEKTIQDVGARTALTDEIVQSARRLDRVVENLLDISRLETGTLRLKLEWFELSELISEAIAGVESEAARIRREGDETQLLEGDFRLLEHALFHLLSNALKYSPPGSEVRIRSEMSRGSLRVIVADSGPGVPVGMEERIFEKFFRAPGVSAGGLGLGLSIVKSIVELHEGRVVARARSAEQGAEFVIELPFKPAPSVLQEAIR